MKKKKDLLRDELRLLLLPSLSLHQLIVSRVPLFAGRRRRGEEEGGRNMAAERACYGKAQKLCRRK